MDSSLLKLSMHNLLMILMELNHHLTEVHLLMELLIPMALPLPMVLLATVPLLLNKLLILGMLQQLTSHLKCTQWVEEPKT